MCDPRSYRPITSFARWNSSLIAMQLSFPRAIAPGDLALR